MNAEQFAAEQDALCEAYAAELAEYEPRKATDPKRFYVSMTWDDWPEGGSYGTTVMADDYDHAEQMTKWEMAISREDESVNYTVLDVCKSYWDSWHVVDCYEVRDQITLWNEISGSITVIVTEQSSPFPPAYPAPLIYQLEGVAATDEDEILRQIAILRHEEIEGDEYDDVIIDQIRQGLRLQFVVAGELHVARDYRT